jgi:fibronectin-binding autotransporter adhesin
MLLLSRGGRLRFSLEACRSRAIALFAGALRLFALLLLVAHSAHADKTWKNSGTDWNTNTNWNPSGVPGTSDYVLFSSAMSTQPNLSASDSVLGLYFSTTTASGYDITSSSTSIKLTLASTGTGAGTSAIYAANTSGSNTIDAPLVLGAAGGSTQTFTQASGGTLVINGIISSTNSVTLSLAGSGIITLAGANTYSGGTILASGTTLRINNATALGTGTFTINGGIIDNTTASAITLSNNNAQTWNGDFTFTGTQSLNMGTGAISLGTAAGTTRTITVNGSTLTEGGIISNGTTANSLTKAGTGTLTLTGANTYTGSTTVSAGVLNIRNASALGGVTNGTTVSSGAALQIQNGIAVGLEALTLNGSGIASDGALRNISGTNSWSGAVTLGSAATIGSDSGTLTLSGTINNGTFNLTTTGAGNITLSGIISGSGGLTKNGSGTLTLNGINTYSGTTTVNAGTLQLGVVNSLPSTSAVTVSGGTLDLQSFGQSVGSVTLSSGTITSSTGVLTGTSFSLQSGTVSAIIAGAGTVTKSTSGTVTLSGVNTYTGSTLINAGTLQINTNGALGTTLNGTTVASGAALKLNGVNYTTAEALTLNGSGISGAGALTNSGTSTFAGAITIATNATISPGGGTLTLSGGISKNGTTLTFAGGGTVYITTNGITGSSPNSDLVIDGTTVELDTANTYNGPTTIQNSGVLRLGASNVLPTSPRTDMTINTSSIFDLNSYSDGVASLTGDSTAIIKNSVVSTTSTLTVSPGSGSTTFAGVIAGTNGGAQGNIALVKTAGGTLMLTGANTFSGSTTISGGTLILADTTGSALGSTSSITVNSSGTLLLGASNQINNSAGITLAGGTFSKGNYSEGTASSVGMGALTLTATGSHIDFGTGTVGILTFASFTSNSNTLIIDNWTGTANTVGSASTDRLIFDSDQSANLSNFWFAGYAPGASEFSLGGGYYEVVPTVVPEPATYVAGILGFLVVASTQIKRCRRRRRRRVRLSLHF